MMGTRPVTQQDSEGDKPVRVHFIVHEHFEAPGAFETWAMTRGNEVTRIEQHRYHQWQFFMPCLQVALHGG